MILISGLKNPLTLMSYVSPVMAVATALLSLALDPWDKFRENKYFDNSWHITRSCLLLLFGGALAFFMVGVYIPFMMHICSFVPLSLSPTPKEEFKIFIVVGYYLTCF